MITFVSTRKTDVDAAIEAFSAVDPSTTPDENDMGATLIIVQDTPENRDLGKRFHLKDVTEF